MQFLSHNFPIWQRMVQPRTQGPPLTATSGDKTLGTRLLCVQVLIPQILDPNPNPIPHPDPKP